MADQKTLIEHTPLLEQVIWLWKYSNRASDIVLKSTECTLIT